MRVDHNECIKGILHNYILVALSVAITILVFHHWWSTLYVMAAIILSSAITDGSILAWWQSRDPCAPRWSLTFALCDCWLPTSHPSRRRGLCLLSVTLDTSREAPLHRYTVACSNRGPESRNSQYVEAYRWLHRLVGHFRSASDMHTSSALGLCSDQAQPTGKFSSRSWCMHQYQSSVRSQIWGWCCSASSSKLPKRKISERSWYCLLRPLAGYANVGKLSIVSRY